LGLLAIFAAPPDYGGLFFVTTWLFGLPIVAGLFFFRKRLANINGSLSISTLLVLACIATYTLFKYFALHQECVVQTDTEPWADSPAVFFPIRLTGEPQTLETKCGSRLEMLNEYGWGVVQRELKNMPNYAAERDKTIWMLWIWYQAASLAVIASVALLCIKMFTPRGTGTGISKKKIPKLPDKPDFDTFLSHNSEDKPVVRELAEKLVERGLKPWLDEWELVPGRRWQDELEQIIQTTKTAVVMFGPAGLGPWEDSEMQACLDEFVQRKLPVIPVLLPGAHAEPELPLFLRPFTWVDLRGGLNNDGLDRLVWGITGEKPGSAP
jgi:hypothetical protein